MRASMLLAAAFCLSAIQPVMADDLVRDVRGMLYCGHHGLFSGMMGRRNNCRNIRTQSAVISAGNCATNCAIGTQPAVLAQAGCSTAILTRDPSDLDIRRERLIRDINCLSLGGCEGGTLNAAMLEINNAELAMRSDGYLDNYESRRLYRAMDRVGRHLDRWSGRGSGFGSYIGLAPGFWY